MSMFSIQDHSFIDQLLAEYDSNQKIFSKITQKLAQAATPTRQTQATPYKIANKKTEQLAASKIDFSKILVIVPETQRDKLPQENKDNPVERALSAHRQGLDLIINCSQDVSKYALISELYLQSLLQATGPGLHLFLVSQDDAYTLGHWLGTTTFTHGLKRAWSSAFQNEISHEKLMLDYLNLLQKTLTLHLPNKKTNPYALCAVLSLIPNFSKKIFFENFNPKTKIFTGETTRKVAQATYLSLNKHLGDKQVHTKISLAIDEGFEFLSQNGLDIVHEDQCALSKFRETLQKMRASIASNDLPALSKLVEWNLSFFRLDGKNDLSLKFYQIYFLFMGRLCAISREKFQDVKNDSIPKEKFSSFIPRLTETATVIENFEQIYKQIDSLATTKTFIVTTSFFECMGNQERDKFFSLPLRSFFLYGHDQRLPEEWHKLTALIPKVLQEAKQRYFQEPAPFHAIFADNCSRQISCTSEKSS